MITARIEGNKLIIEADLAPYSTLDKKTGQPKSVVIVSSGGNQTVPGCDWNGIPVKIGLNAYVPHVLVKNPPKVKNAA